MTRFLDWLSFANRPLQDRLATLIASAVAAAVAVTGISAYFLTLLTVYDQLDNELIEVASITSGVLAEDLENLGGVDPSAWQAANVIVMLIRSDNHVITMPGRQVSDATPNRSCAIASSVTRGRRSDGPSPGCAGERP